MKKLIILIVCSILVTGFINSKDYVQIPSTSIRMRVIASSNTNKSQEDKRIVKKVLEEEIYKTIGDEKNQSEVERLILNNKDDIDNKIKSVMKNENIDYSFSSNYGYNYFPQKEFKGVIYPAGNYKSYVVTLGEGKGENWWCVLYPPLCLIDEDNSEYEYHSLIKDILNQYN